MIAKKNTRQRVFILGAGFSRAAGLPDATELTQLLRKTEFLKEDDDFNRWFDDFAARINGNQSESLNIEQLFDFAVFDRELWLMKHQEAPVEYVGFAENAANIDQWLDELERQLVYVMSEQESHADKSRLLTFVAQLQPSDIILTFNYDTVLEQILTEENRQWSYGFENKIAEGAITIAKLHGSLNWFMTPRPKIPKDGLLLFHDRRQDIKLCKIENPSVVNDCLSSRDGVSMGRPVIPGLGGLGMHKPLHKLTGSGKVWRRAFAALKDANELYVIGWSASEYDTMARFHFHGCARNRESPLGRLVVIDPNAAAITSRVESIFTQETISIPEKVEAADWSWIFGV